ncbi:helix-turn-helix transcriptional regulator [Microbacterium sp.]|uniref:helix-turn-helix domain-containing protein n=1 Tax=Microbacterium sp. TaxID=51671 RepID=UPI0026013CD6|nr:helix-turn-helix transcriptional regulator [Microbacterium sp.]MBT9606688.1 helix-turn-helix transcriptional regulator [Microbacterium sp.]
MTEELEDDRLDAVLHRLGQRVRAMRLARDLSITALSFEAELSEDHLQALEAGRTTPPLPVLVALADVFEVGVADLFGDGAAPPDGTDEPRSSRHVVPSPVIWGGELPPAPWMTPAAPETPTAATVPAPSPPLVAPAAIPAAAIPPATGIPPVTPSAPQPSHSSSLAAPGGTGSGPYLPSAVPRVHQRAAERGMQGESPYVFVAPGAGPGVVPRTFADLRTGPLEGRNFRSLQEFAVASVVEGRHSIPDVARVFRVPPWRLEQWVRETGHAV